MAKSTPEYKAFVARMRKTKPFKDSTGKSKLNPCQFCGGTAQIVCPGMWQAVCHKCGVRTYVLHTKEEAIELWNRRAAK